MNCDFETFDAITFRLQKGGKYYVGVKYPESENALIRKNINWQRREIDGYLYRIKPLTSNWVKNETWLRVSDHFPLLSSGERIESNLKLDVTDGSILSIEPY